MVRHVHALSLPLRFPSGIAPGEGGDYNVLTVARDGNGRPVLRGTALAGALRHAWVRYLQGKGLPKDEVTRHVRRFFGWALEARSESGAEPSTEQSESRGIESALQVSDTILSQGKEDVGTRTHHWRNRHTGVVMAGGLYSLECCPPGSSATVVLWLRDQDSDVEAASPAEQGGDISVAEFISALVGSLERGLTLGGSSARGIGMVELDRAAIAYKSYDLSDVNQHASFLDDHRHWRRTSELVPSATPLPIDGSDKSAAATLEVDLCLVIPRGQDLLIGDGQGLDHEMEPQRAIRADGTECWRLPGGSLRGIFRAWAARLAARDPRFKGRKIVDDARSYDDLPAARKPKPPRIEPADRQRYLDCPINKLFGSVFAAGRIHISDAEAPCLPKTTIKVYEKGKPKDRDVQPEEQLRMHVAVDRVTGGAAESMLFDNTVLTAGPDGESPVFHVSIRVHKPEKHEVEWLVATLRAIDLGILRIGSSKSSGRLCLKKAPDARGNEAFVELFRDLAGAALPQRG